jgi:mannitol 2-dehydrogenase
VLAVMRAASTRIVSLTITEGGYLFHPSTGEFDAEHPLIQPDLAEDATPTTPFGLIVEALAASPGGRDRAVHGDVLRQHPR